MRYVNYRAIAVSFSLLSYCNLPMVQLGLPASLDVMNSLNITIYYAIFSLLICDLMD